MAGCCDNFSMIDGGDEFKAFPGLKGEDGTTYYPHVSADGILSWTNDGGKTNPDPVDISGPPGRSVEMRGPVASVSDLPTTADSDELWLVGSTSPYDGWFYNGTSWQNIGQISVGPPGPQGEQGEDGFSPTISTNEVSGGCFITITDATGTETVFLSNGASAGFGTPTATVDANVGTPSVEVTATGPNTAKVFNFAFHNLKGESGGGGGGTSDYNDLSNKPSIQGVTLSGNKTASDLGLALATEVLPAGGSTMDFLRKSSNTDYAAEWVSLYSGEKPLMDSGSGDAGLSSLLSRRDHRHPVDTSRASVADLATYTRPNLLDNWYFVGGGSQQGYGVFPVNQKGQTSYSQTWGNKFDRWKGEASLAITTSYLSIINTNQSRRTGIVQIPTEKNSLIGKQVTFSILLDNGDLFYGTKTIPSSGSIDLKSFNGHSLKYEADYGFSVYVAAGATLNVIAMKVELGTTQTLAHQESGAWVLNEIPDYAEELAKCQAYYLKTNGYNIAYTGIFTANATSVRFTVPTPCTMAGNPSVSFGSGLVAFENKSTGQPVRIDVTPSNASLTFDVVQPNCVRLTLTPTTAFEGNQFTMAVVELANLVMEV